MKCFGAFVSVVVVLLWTGMFADEIHTFKEIMDVLKQSELTYALNGDEHVACHSAQYNQAVNLHGLFLEKQNGKVVLKRYSYSGDVAKFLNNAERFFGKYDYKQALDNYLSAWKLSPHNSQLMTYIGQAYRLQGQTDKTIEWYKKAIDENPLDYMAHWFLADLYAETGKKQKALREITAAHILHPLNPRILVSLHSIYALNGLLFPKWHFAPCYQLKKRGKHTVEVTFPPDKLEWMAYASCEAAWQYEPGYKESVLQKTKQFPLFVREKECLLSAYTVYRTQREKGTAEADSFFDALQRAIKKKMLHTFVLYEIVLKQNENVAYVISSDLRAKIADYLLKVKAVPIGSKPSEAK